ncbi:DNA-dependent metalloprotease WSS1 [Ananas comosus]|uniref:DNA-dependent metalloprotease WSS1 n=1 Tax=Ananas comosus TaxID=4615 RepID=A0A6P5GSH7_ANACO|nr:DNA-dependent metalloprotease WSS1 [Ananas comosus]
MNLGDLNKVWEIRALKKPGEEEAGALLQRVAKQVEPIMRRRKWRVKLLSEFCPANPSLLGLNVGGGAEVKLRLRRPNRDWDFFPFDQVLDTMLHELCHIEHGPHNAQFYKLWDEIRKECEELMSKGITGTGQGFDAPGRRLGGFSRQPPVSSLRQTALAAAEKRARGSALMPSGPRRLGGNNDIMSALSPIQAAAMAAERRLYDDVWCASGWHDLPTVAESSSKDIGGAGSSHGEKDGTGKRLRTGTEGAPTGSSPDVGYRGASVSGVSSSNWTADSAEDRAMWECSVCTLLNQPLSPICEACGTAKPKAAGSKFKMWSCKFCTLENSIKVDKCSACGQWRYSYGAPLSTPGPTYGT